ncbi:TlpA family protein disulfide reductase [Alterisphingorhabdus coralli]|uniref:TlpA disulfide reductase family protein n=1 Tax=Alterisphingorhabdus coralli TaxID=3071408 RepID=A0AA97F871_9SPHN|nr:TlpA disulfide reductase family protein [Parasphingorhabdus sp. SCSIO 66989]WOE76214.1 TlpA disulfide reductase family protein [Parasphingorhabdus sp. SCSIO 66989]
MVTVPSSFIARLSAPIMILALLFSLAACDTQSATKQQDNAATSESPEPPPPPGLGPAGKLDITKRGTPAPDVSFTAPDGSAVTLAKFRGKPLLVNLWATWCAPCVFEMPTLDRLAEREAERLQVLVVSQDNQGAELVDPFFAEKKFTRLEPYLDTENALGFAINTGIMPTTILYDSQGKEVWRMLGGMDWTGVRAASMLEDTLAQGRE